MQTLTINDWKLIGGPYVKFNEGQFQKGQNSCSRGKKARASTFKILTGCSPGGSAGPKLDKVLDII